MFLASPAELNIMHCQNIHNIELYSETALHTVVPSDLSTSNHKTAEKTAAADTAKDGIGFYR